MNSSLSAAAAVNTSSGHLQEEDSFLHQNDSINRSMEEEEDPLFECDAPKYIDFRAMRSQEVTPAADKWFEGKNDTPFSQRSMEAAEPLYDSELDGEDSVDEDHLFTQDNASFESADFDVQTPKRGMMPGSQTPQAYGGKANHADKLPNMNDEILDENTLTPRPSKKSLALQELAKAKAAATLEEPSAPSEFVSSVAEDEEEQAQKRFANLRMNFTPMKGKHGPSKLSQEIKFAAIVEQEGDSNSKMEHAKKIHVLVGAKSVKPVGAAFMPARSTKPLTIPKEFNFAQRPARKVASAFAAGGNFNSWAAPKRTVHAGKTMAAKPKVTVPMPFRLHDTLSRPKTACESKSPYVPLAERLRTFDKTPDRYKKNLTMAKPVVAVPAKRPAALTRPKSPKFATSMRIKKDVILTTEERQLKEIQSMQPFKARPVDQKILNSAGDLGVPRVKKAIITVAHSPQITKSNKNVHVEKAQSPPRIIKANPFHAPKPFQPKIEHRVIKPSQFKLPGEELSERKRQQLEDKKRQEEEALDRHRDFKANPMIIGYVEPPRHVAMKPVVDPKSPFLHTKARGQVHRRVLEEKLKQESEEKKLASEFHAQPVPIVEPFVPKRADRPTTENEPICLNTELRAQERKVFEEELKTKEKMMEHAKERQQHEEQFQIQNEIRKLREQARFRANPVPRAIPFEPKKSNKPLTEPISPFLGEKRRKAVS